MAKNTNKLRCIHCLGIPDVITKDHVIPKSWYSENSKKSNKPTAPSCYECNQGLGKQEEIVSHLMWLCMPETNPLVPELREKVFRACGIRPDGKDMVELGHTELNIRKKYRKKLVDTTSPASDLNESLLMPGFSFHPGYSKEQHRYTRLDKKLVEGLAKKVIRGLEYIQEGQRRYIDQPYSLEVYFPHNPEVAELRAVKNLCPIFTDGTNTIQRGVVPSKPLEPVYIVRLWEHWEIWGIIAHENEWNK